MISFCDPSKSNQSISEMFLVSFEFRNLSVSVTKIFAIKTVVLTFGIIKIIILRCLLCQVNLKIWVPTSKSGQMLEFRREKKDQICRIKSLFQVHWTYQMHEADFRELYTVVSRSVGLTLLFQVSKHML